MGSFLNLLARLGLDISGFATGLKKSESMADKWGRDVSSRIKGYIAGAFGTAAIATAMKAAIDYGGKINDLSTAYGISTKALQEFDYAASQNSATLDDITRVLAKLAQARQKALDDPTLDVAKSFTALGVSFDDLKNKKLEDLFKQIGEAFREANNPQQLFADGLAVMGKSAQSVFPLLIEGLSESAQAANELGIILHDRTIAQLDELGDAMDDLKGRSRTLAAEVGTRLITVFTTIGNLIAGGAAKIGAFLGAATVYGNGREGVDKAMIDADELVTSALVADMERMEAVRTARRKRQGLALLDLEDLDRDASGKKKKQKVAATHNSPQDELTRVGGFAQRGDFAIQTLQQRIAKATEETARNTKARSSTPTFLG